MIHSIFYIEIVYAYIHIKEFYEFQIQIILNYILTKHALPIGFHVKFKVQLMIRNKNSENFIVENKPLRMIPGLKISNYLNTS